MPTTDPITIIDVLEVSEQGTTNPYLCEASDNKRYYVKGWGAGVRSLLCEWVAGHLGNALGLPIPDFAILWAPPELADSFSDKLNRGSLGSGPVFGSLTVQHSEEFRLERRTDVPRLLEIDILMFDFWVRNADRTLTNYGGNPNLLWDLSASKLVAIDHNLAFDVNFDQKTFWETHVFANRRRDIWNNLLIRNIWAQRLTDLLPIYAASLSSAPREWFDANEGLEGAGKFDEAENLALLEACRSQEFWSKP